MNAEKLLDLVADSAKMPGWNDALSITLGPAQRGMPRALEEDELCLVAAGVSFEEQLAERLKKGLNNKL